MLSVATHVAFGVEPSEISFFFFLYFCQMCGGIAQIVDTERKGYAQEWKVQVSFNIQPIYQSVIILS